MIYNVTLPSSVATTIKANMATVVPSNDADEELLGEGPIESTDIIVEGKTILIKYRGVDPSLPIGSKEYKRAKRLADNRASAARSRALARVKNEGMEYKLKALEESYKRLQNENQRLLTLVEKSKSNTMTKKNSTDSSGGKEEEDDDSMSDEIARCTTSVESSKGKSKKSKGLLSSSLSSTVSRQSSETTTVSFPTTNSRNENRTSSESSLLSSVPAAPASTVHSFHPRSSHRFSVTPEDTLRSFISSNPSLSITPTINPSSSSLSSVSDVPTVIPELLTSPERSLDVSLTGKKRRTNDSGTLMDDASSLRRDIVDDQQQQQYSSPSLSSSSVGSNPLSPISSRCTSPVSKRGRCGSSSSGGYPSSSNGKEKLSTVIRRSTEIRSRHFFSVAALCSALFACLITLLDGSVSAAGYADSKSNGNSNHQEYMDDDGFCYDTDYNNGTGNEGYENFVPIDMNDLGSSSDSNHSYYDQFHHKHHSSKDNEYNTFFEPTSTPDDFNSTYNVLFESNFENDILDDMEKVPGLINDLTPEDLDQATSKHPDEETDSTSNPLTSLSSRTVSTSTPPSLPPSAAAATTVTFVDPFRILQTTPVMNNPHTVHLNRRGETKRSSVKDSSVTPIKTFASSYFADPSKLFAYMGAKETFVQKVPEFLQFIRNTSTLSINSEPWDEDTAYLVNSLEDLWDEYRNPVNLSPRSRPNSNNLYDTDYGSNNVFDPPSSVQPFVYTVPDLTADSLLPSASMTAKIILCISLLSAWIAKESSIGNHETTTEKKRPLLSSPSVVPFRPSSNPYPSTLRMKDNSSIDTSSIGTDSDNTSEDIMLNYLSTEKKSMGTSFL